MAHKCSVYKNSCIRPPVNPTNRRPTPHYERSSSAEMAREGHKDEISGRGGSEKIALCEEIIKENSAFQSLMDFYSNIPDYRDMNHLSEEEFYRQLERLKIRQDELRKTCGVDVRCSARDSPAQGTCLPDKTPKTNDHPDENFEPNPRDCDNDSLYSSTQRLSSHNPSKKSGKSVRINSGLSTLRSDTTHLSEEEKSGRRSKMRSKSASPFRSQVTVPRPFRMTQREEEERMLEDLMMSTKCFTPNEERKPNPTPTFKANPVPLTSRIPLYNSIRADQEHKSQLAKLNSSIELQSQMKPFHFSEKEDRPRSRCLSRSVSSTNLTTPDTSKSSSKHFRAKPCPKNLFSNYFYNKMWEDEYFRNLNKKIRAEELLKMASLPPSMARRESKTRGDTQRNGHTRRSRRRTKKKGAKREMHQPICDDRKDSKGNPGKCTSHSGNSSNSSSSFSSPMPIYPINRPNLAATLRFQHSQKKLRELAKPSSPPEHLSRQRHVDWGIRKNPAWKAIYYDGTNLEDIAVRVATRRAEQKLLVEDHKISMELMKQRVRAAPLLLEGATYWGPKVGQLSHTCASKVDPGMRRSRRPHSTGPQSRNPSKMSYYSDTRKPSRKCPHEDLL
ncbi:protein FAM161A [Phlebotomus papatasi]|uniref:protein FAM161A n=1 Tax=Phlebotomus papatasi TaxID=29031 RepID=UPI002483B099|nr:protein FAM161A [Phlebotomus papatasi]